MLLNQLHNLLNPAIKLLNLLETFFLTFISTLNKNPRNPRSSACQFLANIPKANNNSLTPTPKTNNPITKTKIPVHLARSRGRTLSGSANHSSVMPVRVCVSPWLKIPLPLRILNVALPFPNRVPLPKYKVHSNLPKPKFS